MGELLLAVRRGARLFVVLGVVCVAAVVGGAQSGVAHGQTAVLAATQTLFPVADAYVDASNPSGKFGTQSTLRVDASPVQRSFLRFDLSGVAGTVTSATLRVWAETGQATGYDVYGVSDNAWGETTISDSNAPTLAATRTGFSGAVAAGSWTNVVVTPLVTTGHSVSFALKTTNSTALRMSSKETTTAANKPQLVVQTTPSSDTQAPTTPTGLTAARVDSTHTRLDWSASSDNVGVTGYSIYRDNVSTPATTVSGSTLTFTDTVAANSTHSYTVDAFDAAGNHSAKTASVIPPDAPGCQTSTNGTAYLVTVCLTAPTSGTVSGAVAVSATVSPTSLNGQAVPSSRWVIFCVDGSSCTSGANGYALSDYTSPYGFSLPSARWVDGAHTLQARVEMNDSFAGQPTPAVNLTFNNGVTQPPVNGNTFTPTSGTTPGQGQPLVVAAVGDGASGESNETLVVNEIAGWNPNLVLYLGDVYEKGSASEFFNYYDNGGTLFGRFRSITDPTIGNHEYSFDNQASGYFNYWDTQRHYYSFDAGGWHFISLDSTSQFNQTSPGSGQYTWLQGDLAADTAQCTLVYYHHPIYNVGPEGQFTDGTRLAPIWSLLATHGGVLVLNGHDHDYQRWTPLDGNGTPNPNGVTEIVVGSGGHGLQNQVTSDSRLYFSDFAHFGALRLNLNPTGADISFIDTGGQTRDSFPFTCNPAPTTPPPAPTLTLTPLDANDSVTGSTVFYNPSAASGSFTVSATATGATSTQFPNVFTSGDGGTDSTDPFAQTYNWTSGAPTSGPFAVTAANAGGTSPPSQFTVTPDGAAPSTTMLCNFGSCAAPFSSTVSVSLVSSDAGSGVQSTYYTLDGTDPTTSLSRTLYTGPFLIPSTTTVRFYALDKLGIAETPQTQTVTVNTGGGGIAYVQQKTGSASAASLQVTLQSASISGDGLVASIALAAGSSATVTNVTDSGAGTWTRGPVGFLGGSNSRVEIWYRLGASSVTSVTVTLSASKALSVNVSEWSGVATALPASVDGSAGQGFASSTTAPTPSVVTSNATDLVIGAINYPANTATSTLASGSFTNLDNFNSGTSVHGRAAYQITSAAGSLQSSWTLTASSGGNGGGILALKAAAAGGNTAPTANPVSLAATTAVSTPWTPSVSDPDVGDTLTCSIVTQPVNGTASVNSNCSGGTYQSNAAFVGSDPFTYKVNDGHVDSASATVTVTVSGGNTAPTANPVSLAATTAVSTPWTPSVSDPDVGDTLTCSIVTQPVNGTASVNSNCSGGTYQSNAAFVGSDPFTYKVNDGHVDSASATVTVTVSGGNTAPTANPVSLAATTAVSTPWTPSVSDPDVGDTLTCSIVTQPVNGTASVNSNCSGGTYQSNAAFVGSDPFTYKVNDGHVDSASATVTVTVSGASGISFVQEKQVGFSSAATLPMPLNAPSASGHALVAVVAFAAGSSASVSGVTDSGSGTWLRGPIGYLTGVNSRVEIWYRLNASSVTSVTVTLSAAKAAAVNVTEWSGVATASPAGVDGSSGGSGASSTTASTPALTTGNATDLVIGAINYPSATAVSTLAAGPFTGLTNFNGATSVHGRAAYAITSATGSFQASWTLTAVSGGHGGAILALKAA